MCTVECAGAVYEERHNSVVCRSTYGQVVFGIQCIGLNGVCIYIAVFIYREFIVCCVEIAGAVYEERHNSVFCHSTYGQIVFGIQCVGLNGVYIDIFVQLNLNSFNAVFCILAYADVLVTFEIDNSIIFNLCQISYNAISCQVPAFVSVIRCRISSHRRSHACTGHNTCCNQHCQQLFGRAAFTAMIFCDFGDNNICVARLTPNYFKYFVHKKFLPHKYYYLYTVRDTCHVWKQVKQLLYNYPCTDVAVCQHPLF